VGFQAPLEVLMAPLSLCTRVWHRAADVHGALADLTFARKRAQGEHEREPDDQVSHRFGPRNYTPDRRGGNGHAAFPKIFYRTASASTARVGGIDMFNPFGENLRPSAECIDDTVELGKARFVRDVAKTERLLEAARPGTRVVTYCGWGGVAPDDYRLHTRERYAGTLELWIKTPGYSRKRDPIEQEVALFGGATLRELRE